MVCKTKITIVPMQNMLLNLKKRTLPLVYVLWCFYTFFRMKNSYKLTSTKYRFVNFYLIDFSSVFKLKRSVGKSNDQRIKRRFTDL